MEYVHQTKMQKLTPFRYWELIGNPQYLKQIQEIQKLKQHGEQQGYHTGNSEARIVEGVRVDQAEESNVKSVSHTGKRCGIAACGSDVAYSCNGCRNVFYCSTDHQKEDWECHRRSCALYTVVKEREGDTTTVVASYSLDETFVGSVILEEKPLVTLPQVPSEGDYMVCIGCCKPISWEEKLARCRNCSWPVCHDGCDGEVSLHSDVECNILSPVCDSSHWNKRGGYESLWMIRIICLKSINRVAYKRIMEMEVGQEILEKEDIVPHRFYAVQTLRRMYDVQSEDFNDEELNHIWNVLRLKCVSSLAFLHEPFKRAKLLYEDGGKFRHSCYPNASYEIDFNFMLRISLQRPVEICESFSINFDSESLFQPTRSRRARLQKIFKIECSCTRCSDVTELGTYFGGIPCHSRKTCSLGESPGYLLQTNNKDPQSPWECLKCHTVQLSNLEVQSWLYSIQQGLESVCKKQEPYQLCMFVDKLVEQQILHQYHHLVFDYYVETLKLFNQQLENDPEMRNIDELLKYKQAARCVCKIMRSFLPIHANLIGPLPLLSTLIKMAGLVEGFKNKTVQMARVLQDLERYVIKTEYGFVVLRNGPLVVPENTEMKLFINEVINSLAGHFQVYICEDYEKDSQAELEELKVCFNVIQNYFRDSNTDL